VTGPGEFWELVDQVEELGDKVVQDICDTAGKAADALNDAANGVLNTLKRLLPGTSTIDKAIDKWNNEIEPAIQKGIDELPGQIAEAVSQLAGDPKALMEYAAAFTDAKGTLYTNNTLDQDIAQLGFSWHGDAYTAYSTVASKQSAALQALANNLQQGGQLTTDGANKILGLWLDLVNEFMTFEADALSLIGKFADMGAVLGAEVSPILDTIGAVAGKVWDVTDILAEFWKDQVTTTTMSWNALNAGFDGMPQNQWPVISEGMSDAMNDPARWPA
jgi:uncharacterized protein YukE